MWEDKTGLGDGWDEERLAHLFNSERSLKLRGKSAQYPLFARRLAAGQVLVRTLDVRCEAGPRPAVKGQAKSPNWQLFRRCRRGGSDLHGWLKWFAYHWLTEREGAEPQLEVTLAGYGRADLCIGRVKVALECGNTSPGHAMRLFEQYPGARFIDFPFQRGMLENLGERPTRVLQAVEFRAVD